VRVTDEFGRTAVFSAKWELMYNLTITTTSVVGVIAGSANSVNLPTVGGAYGTKSFTGVGMPTGMTINPATGALEGTPLAADVGKMFPITITVVDSKDGETKSSSYSVGVASGPITPAAGQNTTLKFRMDEDGVFSFKFDNIVGTPTYSQPASYSSVIDPATGVVTTKAPFPANTYTGPTGAWTGNLYYVTDALGRTGTVTYSVTNVYGITISSTASVGLVSGVTANANAPTVANVYGTKTFSGTGMPTGMTINPTTGALTGTPLASDEGKSFTVTVTVTDGYDGKSKSTTYTAYVVGQFKAQAGQQTTWPVRIGGPVTMTGPKFDNAVGTVTFSKVSGDNAFGINSATGQITALSPTSTWVLGTFPVVIRARDANARTADITLYIKTVGTLSLSTTGASVEINKAISSSWLPVATNAGGPTYTATGLPSGVSVDPKTGALSGTPSVAGTYGVTMTLTDFDGAKATSTFSLVVTP
jgi:hypothetical protein